MFFIQILYSYHKSSSICTSIYHLSFVQISNFFYLLQFLSQSINSNVPLGYKFLRFSISFLNIVPCYLTSFFKKKHTHTHTINYILLLNIIILNQKIKYKKEHYCTRKVHLMNSVLYNSSNNVRHSSHCLIFLSTWKNYW